MKTNCVNRILFSVALALAVLVMSTGSALAQLSHNLTTISPTLNVVSGQSNLNVDLELDTNFGDDTDDDSTPVSGVINSIFSIDFSTGNLRINDFHITGGQLMANKNMSFNLSVAAGLANINATTSNIKGSPFSNTTSDLSPVATPSVMGEFDADDHGLSLNTGTINVTGVYSDTIDLSTQPIQGVSTSSDPGEVILTQGAIDLEANTTTYSLSTLLPVGVEFQESGSTQAGIFTVNYTITLTGTGEVLSSTDLVFDWVPWNGIAGDINQDGDVDPLDIDAFVDGWRSTNDTPGLQAYMLGDLNFDGVTDLYDASLFRNALMGAGLSMGSLASLLSGGAAVPEPATWATGLIGVGLLLAGRRQLRRRA